MNDKPAGNPADRDLEQSSRDLVVNAIPDGYVPVFDSPDFETGEIVCATLVAAGIDAIMQNPTVGPAANALPFLGNTWSHAVYVPPDSAEAARGILAAPPLTEDELAAEQAADPTTLEEAENTVRDA